MLKRLIVLTVVVGAILMLAGNALASPTTSSHSQAVSLYRPFPEGLPANNANLAFQQVMNRASWDNQYATAIAQQTGATSFNPTDYAPFGYRPHAPAGTTNSALNGSGMVVPVADHGGSQNVMVFVVINIRTKQTVSLMVRCGNPRLHPFVPVVPFKPFSKGTVIVVNRSVSKPISITCPSGQTVSGTITATVKGVIRARTWGMVQGNLNLKLQQQVQLQVKAFANLSCGPAPTPPPAPTSPPAPQVFSATATASATASATCPDGTTATASGFGSGSATSTVSQADAQNKAQAIATANAQAQANAAVKCAPVSPPPAPTASVSFNNVQEVNTNESRANTCALVTTSEGMTVVFRADQGSFSGTTPTTVSGTVLVCGTYIAPSETGTDTWHVLVFDNGKLITDATHSISIVQPATNP